MHRLHRATCSRVCPGAAGGRKPLKSIDDGTRCMERGSFRAPRWREPQGRRTKKRHKGPLLSFSPSFILLPCGSHKKARSTPGEANNIGEKQAQEAPAPADAHAEGRLFRASGRVKHLPWKRVSEHRSGALLFWGRMAGMPFGKGTASAVLGRRLGLPKPYFRAGSGGRFLSKIARRDDCCSGVSTRLGMMLNVRTAI